MYDFTRISYKKRRQVVIGFSIVVLGLLYMFKNTSFTIRALSAISLLAVFYLIDHSFDIRFRPYHYVFILVIAISSFLLSPLYFVYPQYDKVQHFVQPIMFASIVFYMMRGLKLPLRWHALFTFFIVTGSLGLLEIGEYLLDLTYDLKLQGVFLRSIQGLEKFDILLDRIDDTMIDMTLGVIGTLVYTGLVVLLERNKLRLRMRNLII